MKEIFLENQNRVKGYFKECASVEAKYQRIIELGKTQKKLSSDEKNDNTQVKGCQSLLWLSCRYVDGKFYFQTEADALISAGLGMLLTEVYSGLDPETIIQHPPRYIEELHIAQTLTVGRANGLASIYVRMKQEALRCLVNSMKEGEIL